MEIKVLLAFLRGMYESAELNENKKMCDALQIAIKALEFEEDK